MIGQVGEERVDDPQMLGVELTGMPGRGGGRQHGDAATGGGQASPLKLPGADTLPPALLVRANGQRVDGRAVQSQAAYFSQGRQVFQAVIYADKMDPEVAETFFSSLKLDAGTPR